MYTEISFPKVVRGQEMMQETDDAVAPFANVHALINEVVDLCVQ